MHESVKKIGVGESSPRRELCCAAPRHGGGGGGGGSGRGSRFGGRPWDSPHGRCFPNTVIPHYRAARKRAGIRPQAPFCHTIKFKPWLIKGIRYKRGCLPYFRDSCGVLQAGNSGAGGPDRLVVWNLGWHVLGRCSLGGAPGTGSDRRGGDERVAERGGRCGERWQGRAPHHLWSGIIVRLPLCPSG